MRYKFQRNYFADEIKLKVVMEKFYFIPICWRNVTSVRSKSISKKFALLPAAPRHLLDANARAMLANNVRSIRK